MLHIILLVLKIILWIILGALGLVLLLAAIVLLAPVHYKADVAYTGKAKVRAKIRYLIVSMTITYDQESGENQSKLRVLGIPLGGGKRRKKRVDSEELYSEEPGTLTEPGTSPMIGSEESGTSSVPETVPDSSPEVSGSVDEISSVSETDSDNFITAIQNLSGSVSEVASDSEIGAYEVSYGEPPKKEIDEDSSELLDSVIDIDDTHEKQVNFIAGIVAKLMDKAEKLMEKILRFFEKIFETAEEFADKLEDKYARLDRLITRIGIFWNLACTEKTKAYLPKYLKSVARHIAPRSAKGHLHYGFDEAYTTGTVTGYLSLLPCMHGKRMYLEPEFHEKVMDVDLHVKGRIVLGYILRIAVNIQLWKTLLAARKLKEQ